MYVVVCFDESLYDGSRRPHRSEMTESHGGSEEESLTDEREKGSKIQKEKASVS
jgi:hypothetical protein